jgi:hypothetical protein
MRSLMLASAAIILSTGAAMAQTTPANGAATTTPYYNGQNAVKTTTTATPDAMTPPQPGPQPKPMPTAMTYSHGAAMPQNADVRTYLHIAANAIRHHDKMTADDALSHAETRLLTRAVPASSGPAIDNSPAVTAIEHARQALAAGDFPTASADTKTAMHMHHGMMGM